MQRTFPSILFFIFALSTLAFAQTDAKSELKFDINAIDKSADPCTDFYQYACGGWLARNPIPADRPYWAVFQQMREINDRRIQDILEKAAVERSERSAEEQKIGDYYFSCMDEKTIEANGLKPLRPELERIAAMKTPSDLAREIAHLHGLGSDALFSLSVDQRLEDASQVIAYVDQSQLNLPEPSYYTSNEADSSKARAGYRSHLEKIFTLLGEDTKQASSAADDVMRIESALAGASLSPLERRDRKAWYHEMSSKQLAELAPAFPWNDYFIEIGFEPKTTLNVAVPAYMKIVSGLAEATSLPAWRNYSRWELVRLATPALPSSFRQSEFEFYRASLRGVKVEDSRSHQCDELTGRDLGEAVGKRYVELYFPAETRQRALDLVDHLRTAMREDFAEISWMTDYTRKEATKKLDLLRAMIGYPDHWRDYSRFEVKRGNALGNGFRGQQFEFQRQLAKIGQPVDRGEFYELPQGVEGYHDNPLNVIVFTAGILQPPFFDPHMDDAINYGLAGGVIGHELSHAFDDKGHLFDGEGNLRNWWTAQDSANYGERAACFVKQYSQYPAIDEVKVNGELTLGENIADNGGLQLSYKAFESRTDRNSPKIDGFTPEQRFFLGWSQWRCMNTTDKTAQVLARTDQHSPGKWRVNGVVSNMPGFAAAYQCKAGSAMVNKDPCRLW
jgi:endothelin-converting enzyme/putative endopeptidase